MLLVEGCAFEGGYIFKQLNGTGRLELYNHADTNEDSLTRLVNNSVSNKVHIDSLFCRTEGLLYTSSLQLPRRSGYEANPIQSHLRTEINGVYWVRDWNQMTTVRIDVEAEEKEIFEFTR